MREPLEFVCSLEPVVETQTVVKQSKACGSGTPGAGSRLPIAHDSGDERRAERRDEGAHDGRCDEGGGEKEEQRPDRRRRSRPGQGPTGGPATVTGRQKIKAASLEVIEATTQPSLDALDHPFHFDPCQFILATPRAGSLHQPYRPVAIKARSSFPLETKRCAVRLAQASCDGSTGRDSRV
ncbi:hypothetical protein [uncultured Brevundimonas sp.]|uniref:hypothetical protein n=1 Tax=uncultured Brevundimonas sp. TaxID=213418 RepID=UPI0025F27089|nr:hypothetical protein [uncultured Brevundimonas sp.]